MKNKRIIAIDPGNKVSAYVEWDGESIYHHGIINNDSMFDIFFHTKANYLFIEKITWGTNVGKEILDTVFWCGRFYQAWEPLKQDNITDINDVMIPRSTIKKHHKATTDSGIRKVLIEKYGSVTKGLKSHEWQALALATWVTEVGFLEDN